MIKDIELINNILEGNKKSEELLYNKYKLIIYNELKYKYGDYPYIEDDISEILTKIFNNLKSYNPELSQFNTWVHHIIKNYMIDKNRRTHINNFITLPSNYNHMYCDENFCKIDTDSTLNYIKSNVPLNDYILLDMKYNMGFNYCEIGDEFNTTSSTISNKVNYIKHKIKNALKDESI